jgi:hypothetical protein
MNMNLRTMRSIQQNGAADARRALSPAVPLLLAERRHASDVEPGAVRPRSVSAAGSCCRPSQLDFHNVRAPPQLITRSSRAVAGCPRWLSVSVPAL